MRKKLKLFRVAHNMSQSDMAKAFGINRGAYGVLERGVRGTTFKAWYKFQQHFNIPDSEMWEFTKNLED